MLVVCTFHFRPPFFTTVVALLDCSHLPTQVAGQQGSYIAHLVNAGYTVGRGGLDQPPPAESRKPGLDPDPNPDPSSDLDPDLDLSLDQRIPPTGWTSLLLCLGGRRRLSWSSRWVAGLCAFSLSP